jgi:phage terminase large subunit-like protein
VSHGQSLFKPIVMLIEDKASGTQLIQELITEGCHAVARSQPTTDKITRLHAKTAWSRTASSTSPRRRRGLTEYLHELTVFSVGERHNIVPD